MAAWQDPDWGTLAWLAMTTGARRGEFCAVRWTDLELTNAVIHLHESIAQHGGLRWTKHTKTHQQRRVALDPERSRSSPSTLSAGATGPPRSISSWRRPPS